EYLAYGSLSRIAIGDRNMPAVWTGGSSKLFGWREKHRLPRRSGDHFGAGRAGSGDSFRPTTDPLAVSKRAISWRRPLAGFSRRNRRVAGRGIIWLWARIIPRCISSV